MLLRHYTYKGKLISLTPNCWLGKLLLLLNCWLEILPLTVISLLDFKDTPISPLRKL